MSLKQVKNQIGSVEKIHKVTKAMEAVSAVKMRKAQERALTGRPYAIAALTILHRVSGSLDSFKHPLSEKREVKKVCLVVITSDKGLAGSLNGNVMREAMRYVSEYGKKNVMIIAIGKKAAEFFRKQQFQVLERYENISDDIKEKHTEKLVERITARYLKGEFDKAILVYPNFLSSFEQKAVSRTMLPIDREAVLEIVEGIVPVKGRFSNEEERKEPIKISQDTKTQYMVEPDEESVLSLLLPALLSIELYHGVLEAKASEHSARMVAMKNASDKARQLSREFRLLYNKERQAHITAEVSEIIGGIETTK